MLLSMTLFEAVKQFLVPTMTIWLSHTITIVFATIGATVIAYVVLRGRETLVAGLLREAEESRSAQSLLARQLHLIQTLSDAIPSPIFSRIGRTDTSAVTRRSKNFSV